MSETSVAAPADLAELRAMLSAVAGPINFIGGGTDMLIAGRPMPAVGLLIDLSRIAGMAFICADDGGIRVGGATTVAAIAAHRGIATRLPALAEAAAQCGSVQIRNRATIGGNIANAAPAADLVPVLVAAKARLGCIGRDGASRELAICDYAPDRGFLIAEVILPRDGLLPRSAFVKLGPRLDLSISRLNIALLAGFRMVVLAMSESPQERWGLGRCACGSRRRRSPAENSNMPHCVIFLQLWPPMSMRRSRVAIRKPTSVARSPGWAST
jgi:carbon-monoxide dehydrogenase medium subunit